MGHVQELELRYDGRIPAPLLRAAKALDAAERRTGLAARPQAGCRIGRIRLKPDALVTALANAMLNAAAVAGDCSRDYLIGLGFTAQELDRHGARAAHVAAVRAQMRQPIERGSY